MNVNMTGSSKINNDIRHLSSSAKALYELEVILAVPALLEVGG